MPETTPPDVDDDDDDDEDDDDEDNDNDDDDETEDPEEEAAVIIVADDPEDEDNFKLAADCLESLVRVLLMVILMPSELCFTMYSAGFFVSTDEFLAMQEDFPLSMMLLLPLEDDDELPLPIFFSFWLLLPLLFSPLVLLTPEELLLLVLLPPLPQVSDSVQCCAFFNLSITAFKELFRFRACACAAICADLLAASICPEGGVLPPLLLDDCKEETCAVSAPVPEETISSCLSLPLEDDLVLGL